MNVGTPGHKDWATLDTEKLDVLLSCLPDSPYKTQLTTQVGLLLADRDHWKANHDNQVERARILMDRPDLPLERVKAYQICTRYAEENAARIATNVDTPCG